MVCAKRLALVDIGATNSFVAKNFVERYDCPTRIIAPLRVHCAAGDPVRTERQTDKLVMRIGERFASPTRFVVLDLARYDLLLGLDFLRKHRAIVDLGAHKVVLYHQGVEHTFCVDPPPVSEPTPEAEPAPCARKEKPMKQMSRKKFERWVRKHRDVDAFEVYASHAPQTGDDAAAHVHASEAGESDPDASLSSVPNPVVSEWVKPPDIDGMARSTARVWQMASEPASAWRVASRRRRPRRSALRRSSQASHSSATRSSEVRAPRSEVNFVRPEPLTEADIEGIEPQCDICEELTRKFKSMLKGHIEQFQMPDDAWKSCPIEAKIELLPHDRAPSARPYRLSEEDAKQLAAKIDEYSAKGWIIPSNSAYSSPVLFAVKKGTTQKRFCVDYRKINAQTKREECPLPRAEDLF